MKAFLPGARVSATNRETEGKMFGLEVWEIALIASGAIWGAWFMRRRRKRAEDEEKSRREAENARGKRKRR